MIKNLRGVVSQVWGSRRRVGVSSPSGQYSPAVYVESGAAGSDQQTGLGLGFSQGQGLGQGLSSQSMAYSGHHTRP